MRAHGWSFSQVRLHLNIGFIVNCIEILFEVVLEVLFFHFLFEFFIKGICLFVVRIWLLCKLEPRHLLVVFCDVVAPTKVDSSLRPRDGAADC